MSDIGARAGKALLRLAGVSISLVLCGCARQGTSRQVVAQGLERVVGSSVAGPQMVAAVLSERRDCLVTAVNPVSTSVQFMHIRYVVGDAARCEEVAWHGGQRQPAQLVYEVPGAGPSLRALYRLFQHAPEELNPQLILDAASVAHLTTGSHWRYSPVGSVMLRAIPSRVCEQPYYEDDSPESMRRDLRRDLCVDDDFSEQGLNDLLIDLFDDACLEWQATHRPGTSPIADWHNEDTSKADDAPEE